MFHNTVLNFQNKKNNKNETSKEKSKDKLPFSSREKKSDEKPYVVFDTSMDEISKEEELGEKCILNKKCPFYKKFIKIKNHITSFISSGEKLRSINQSLYIALSEKNKLYREVKEENNYLKGVIYNITGIRFSDISDKNKTKNSFLFHNFHTINSTANIRNKSYNLFKSSNASNDKPKKKANKIKYPKLKVNLKNFQSINSRNNFLRNEYTSQSLFNSLTNIKNIKKNSKVSRISMNSYNSLNISYKNEKEEDKSKKEIDNRNSLNKSKSNNKYEISSNKLNENDYNASNYYEMLNNYTKNQKLKINAKESNSSYLSLNVELLNLLKNNITLNRLEYLTNSDEHFLKECQTNTNDVLLQYCDLINTLMGDYKEIIKLSSRMKDIIRGSILLIDSIISHDSSRKFIQITCNILKCDRASLFIIDKVSDKLILYTGEGMKKAQIKIDKNSGIVGACFTECRVIRIEDAYLEEKFNKEIDKITNYRTKSILCYPLIDKEGECFGVIEAINKLNSSFTDDDQELLKLLSQEASSIFKSVASNDNNKFLITKLYLIIDFSVKIQYVKNRYELSKLTEETLLNLFSCMNAVMYFIENDKIVRYYNENEYKKYDIHMGIIGKVVKSKEMIAYKNIRNSEEYNSLIDIKSFDGLLTFPILKKKTKEVCAVIQVQFIGEINKFGKPKESEIKIIKKFCKCIKNWVYNNEQ